MGKFPGSGDCSRAPKRPLSAILKSHFQKNLLFLLVVLAAVAFVHSLKGEDIEQASLTASPVPAISPKLRTNICGISPGMTQLEVERTAKSFGVYLEQADRMNSHTIPYDGRPLTIVYDESHRVRWVTGPYLQLESGESLQPSASLETIRRTFAERLSEVNESVALCEGSTLGLRIDTDIFISVREDGMVFSLGDSDGWNSDRGRTWQGDFEAYQRE